MTGLPVLLGAEQSTSRVVVQVGGQAERMDAAALQREARRHDHFGRLLYLYAQAFMTQVAQSTACNRLHAAEQRLARWLLICRDRVGRDEIPITQETMAVMLGVRRATVTEAASALQREGLIRYRRGVVSIADRPGLEAGDVRVLPDRAGGVRPAARGSRRMSAAPATALVVDDESMVRILVRRMLEPEVCDVVEAEDGESALRLIERGQPAIDVVLTDLVMPGIDGFDLVTVLARHRPDCLSSACRALPRCPAAGCRFPSSRSRFRSRCSALRSSRCSRKPRTAPDGRRRPSGGRARARDSERIASGVGRHPHRRPRPGGRGARAAPAARGAAGDELDSPVRERGGTGRRAGLRILSRKGCGFDSRRSHRPPFLPTAAHVLPGDLVTIDPLLAIASFGIGIVVGLTGMGGGALMTPVLVLFFNIPPLTAVSSDLVASAVMKPVGSLVHLRRGTVNLGLVKWLCVGSVPGAFSGVLIARAFGEGKKVQDVVRLALGVALLLAAAGPDRAGVPAAAERARRRDGRAEPLPQGRPTVALRVAADRDRSAPLGGIVVGLTSVGSGSLIIISLMALYPTLKASELVGNRPGPGCAAGRVGGAGPHPVR